MALRPGLHYSWSVDSFQIFGLQFLLSLVAYGLLAKWYVAPRLDRMGSAWYIPTFVVPALYVTHFMIFTMLIKRAR